MKHSPKRDVAQDITNLIILTLSAPLLGTLYQIIFISLLQPEFSD